MVGYWNKSSWCLQQSIDVLKIYESTNHGDYKNGGTLMNFTATQTFEFQAVWAAGLN
jgi:hypothetical protein